MYSGIYSIHYATGFKVRCRMVRETVPLFFVFFKFWRFDSVTRWHSAHSVASELGDCEC